MYAKYASTRHRRMLLRLLTMPHQCHVPGCGVACANAGALSNHVKAMHPPKPPAGRKRFGDFVPHDAAQYGGGLLHSDSDSDSEDGGAPAAVGLAPPLDCVERV